MNNLLHQGYSYAEAKGIWSDNSKILSKFYKIIKTNNKYKTYKRDIRDQQIRDILETSVPALCHYEDRMGMAESIEVRYPFLDHRIIEYGLNISEENKMRFGWSKYILRKTFKNELPKSIIWRKDKKGFSNPEDYWLKEKLKSFVLDVALSDNSQIYKKNIIDKKEYINLLNRYFRNDPRIWFRDVFCPFSLELWLKNYEDKYASI